MRDILQRIFFNLIYDLYLFICQRQREIEEEKEDVKGREREVVIL